VRKLKEVFDAISQWTVLIGFIAGMMLFFCMFLKTLEPLSPVITFLVVAGFTLHTFKRTWLGIASICGIVVYLLSWPVTGKYGLVLGLSVWITGFFLWLWSVYRSFVYNPRTT
jgi:hypothetical protein